MPGNERLELFLEPFLEGPRPGLGHARSCRPSMLFMLFSDAGNRRLGPHSEGSFWLQGTFALWVFLSKICFPMNTWVISMQAKL